MKSLWHEIEMPRFAALHGDHKTDVLIIGGGICGILTAYFLKKRGISYILCEKDRICRQTSGNTTAKITLQHGLIYSKLIEELGIERAQMYYNANKNALSKYFELCKDIDCGFEEKDNCIYSINDKSALEKEQRAIEKIGGKAYLKDEVPIPIKTVGGVYVPHQAQFHPLRFISEISKDLNIYENTFITKVSGRVAKYYGGEVKADNIVVTTHFPFINKHGSYFLKLYQDRSYVIAMETDDPVDAMYMDSDSKGFSFRSYDDLLLLSGGAHKTGTCNCALEKLRGFAKEAYPSAKERYMWAAQDCMSLDRIPYIGHYSKLTKGLYTASGFNKWGMTSSMAAAIIISSQIAGESVDFGSVFSPSRSIFKPQLCKNAASAAKNLVTPAKKRCPHMGCALKWNSEERTWECPCHGSRFSENGEILDNPSNKRLM